MINALKKYLHCFLLHQVCKPIAFRYLSWNQYLNIMVTISAKTKIRLYMSIFINYDDIQID